MEPKQMTVSTSSANPSIADADAQKICNNLKLCTNTIVSGTISRCSLKISDLRDTMTRCYGEETAKCVRSEGVPASNRVHRKVVRHLQKTFHQRRMFAEYLVLRPAKTKYYLSLEMDSDSFCPIILSFFKSLTNM